MRRLLSQIPIHTVLFGLIPIIVLLSQNIDQLQPSEGTRSFIIGIAFSLVVLTIMRLLLADWRQAAVSATVIVLLFFSYGHVYQLLESASIGPIQLGRHRYLIPLWFSLLLGAILLGRSLSKHQDEITQLLNFLGLFLLAFNLVPILSAGLQGTGQHQIENEQLIPAPNSFFQIDDTDELPDVYYLVTDSYGRFDVLQKTYGFENSEFYEFLEASDFYIAEESRANYLFTHISLASSLNMQYLDIVAPNYTQGDELPLKNNLVRSYFEQAGYSIVGFATGWDSTEWFDADIVLTPELSEFELLRQTSSLNSFESVLLETTLLFVVMDYDALRSTPISRFVQSRLGEPFTIQRQIVLAEFDNLERAATLDGPKFVFAHILPPHGPHVFDAEGLPVVHTGAYNLASGPEGSSQYDSGYIEALKYVNKRLEGIIETIIKDSERPVVIILQSDHGPAAGLNWENPTSEALMAKTSILNAYYLPSSCKEKLYATITPVNSFRLVFNCIFDTELPVLEDQTYYGYDTYIPIEEVISN